MYVYIYLLSFPPPLIVQIGTASALMSNEQTVDEVSRIDTLKFDFQMSTTDSGLCITGVDIVADASDIDALLKPHRYFAMVDWFLSTLSFLQQVDLVCNTLELADDIAEEFIRVKHMLHQTPAKSADRRGRDIADDTPHRLNPRGMREGVHTSILIGSPRENEANHPPTDGPGLKTDRPSTAPIQAESRIRQP